MDPFLHFNSRWMLAYTGLPSSFTLFLLTAVLSVYGTIEQAWWTLFFTWKQNECLYALYHHQLCLFFLPFAEFLNATENTLDTFSWMVNHLIKMKTHLCFGWLHPSVWIPSLLVVISWGFIFLQLSVKCACTSVVVKVSTAHLVEASEVDSTFELFSLCWIGTPMLYQASVNSPLTSPAPADVSSASILKSVREQVRAVGLVCFDLTCALWYLSVHLYVFKNNNKKTMHTLQTIWVTKIDSCHTFWFAKSHEKRKWIYWSV